MVSKIFNRFTLADYCRHGCDRLEVCKFIFARRVTFKVNQTSRSKGSRTRHAAIGVIICGCQGFGDMRGSVITATGFDSQTHSYLYDQRSRLRYPRGPLG
jgi:hypothetical protein